MTLNNLERHAIHCSVIRDACFDQTAEARITRYSP